MDSNFLEQLESVRGRMFETGPRGFLGFWRGVMLPLPIEFIMVPVSKAVLRQLAYLSKTVLLEYLISSLGILSGPVALPFFNASAAALTSCTVIQL